ncbi:MAG: hypothetical protein E6J14_15140 [Chloroflexi bacterium]|nr:MAG: hypothetical protein E6J14_15140 [Chloroflexota bacterium]
MRPIYAVTFDLAAGRLEELVDVSSEWLADGAAPRDAIADLSPGRRSLELLKPGQTLHTEVLTDGQDRLWQADWHYPHPDESDLRCVARISAAQIAARTSIAISVHVAGSSGLLLPYASAPPQLPIVSTLLRRFPVVDGGSRLLPAPRVLRPDHVDDLVGLLVDPSRTRPVVYVSHSLADTPPHLRPFDWDELSLACAGLAHVCYALERQPSMEFAHLMGALGCRNGARIYWPHLTLNDPPRRHNFWNQSFLEAAGDPLPDFLGRWLGSLSAAAFGQSASHAAFRRRALDARFRTHASPDWLDEHERTLSELEELRSLVAFQRQALEEVQRRTPSALAFLQRDPEPPPASVLEAVERAAARCPHLLFLDEALESAQRSHFRRPVDMLDTLLALEEVAALWAEPNGTGQSLNAAAASRGVDMSGRATRLGGSIGRQYERIWNGKRIRLEEHVRIGSGPGAQFCARIYFHKYDPGQFTGRRFVIGHVGAHLEDSTSG